ncbi:MAG TPA: hypothetical protein VMB20_03010 [Candidatus Acidoferrum sp.]|nr:hypothetical protein [Candidatus Acidoferrum sp.]
MRVFFGLGLSLAAGLALMTQALALVGGSPVRVAACTVWSRQVGGNSVLTPNVSLTNGVTVTLVNESTKTTSAITVTGSYHGRTVTDTAKVELKPGAMMTVQRSYYPPSTYIDANAQCHVVRVEFTDGTSWSGGSQ